MSLPLRVSQGQLLNEWLAVEPVRNELGSALARASYPVVDAKQAGRLVKATPVSWTYHRPILRDAGKPGHGKLHVRIEVFDAREPGRAVYTQTYWASA